MQAENLSENPFFYPGAILDATYFYGRAQQTAEVLDALGKGQNVSVVSPRKVGKTSFLHHLERTLVGGPGDTVPRYCCVYLDAQLWSSATYETICRAMYEGASVELGRTGMPLPQPDWPPATFADLLNVLDMARLGMASSLNLRIAFLIDQFEALGDNDNLDKHFYRNFGGAVNDPRRGIRWVTASTQLLPDFILSKTDKEVSQFFDKFLPIDLPLFTHTEAEALLTTFASRARMTLSPMLLRYLLELAGPHPLLLQIAGSWAFKHCADPADQGDRSKLEALRNQFMANAKDCRWRSAWRRLTPEDQRYLVLLPIKHEAVGADAHADTPVIDRLRQAGLIVEEDGGVRAISPAFCRFMGEQSIPGVIQAPPLILDLERNRALYHDQEVKLQPKERQILTCLASQAGKVVPYRKLVDEVWGDGDYDNLERLKTPLGTLCTKLEALDRAHDHVEERIHNIRGVGYEFRPDTW